MAKKKTAMVESFPAYSQQLLLEEVVRKMYAEHTPLDPYFFVREEAIALVMQSGESTRLGKKSKQSSPAAIAKNSDGIGYTMVIHEESAYAIYAASWLFPIFGKAGFALFLLLIQLHECAHVYAASSSYASKNTGNAIFDWVENVLEDARIEYQLTLKYPGCAWYFGLLLSTMRPTIHYTLPKAASADAKRFFRMKKIFFSLLRHGVVLPDMHKEDMPFFSFLLGLFRAAQTGTRFSLVMIADAVYTYFCEEFASNPTLLADLDSSAMSHVGIDDREILSENTFSSAREIRNMAKRIARTIPCDGVSRGSTVLVPERFGTPFYRTTVRKYSSQIATIRAMIARILYKYAWKPSFEGELLENRQMEAYVNAFTHQEERDYALYQRLLLDLDIVFIRDVSGSINRMRIEYAESYVMLLAALEGQKGCRSAAIDFSDNALLVKGFSDHLAASAIAPRSEEGTAMLAGLEMLTERCRFASQRREVVLLTDLGWDDFGQAASMIRSLEKERVHFTIVNVLPGNRLLRKVPIEKTLSGISSYEVGVSQLAYFAASLVEEALQ